MPVSPHSILQRHLGLLLNRCSDRLAAVVDNTCPAVDRNTPVVADRMVLVAAHSSLAVEEDRIDLVEGKTLDCMDPHRNAVLEVVVEDNLAADLEAHCTCWNQPSLSLAIVCDLNCE